MPLPEFSLAIVRQPKLDQPKIMLNLMGFDANGERFGGQARRFAFLGDEIPRGEDPAEALCEQIDKDTYIHDIRPARLTRLPAVTGVVEFPGGDTFEARVYGHVLSLNPEEKVVTRNGLSLAMATDGVLKAMAREGRFTPASQIFIDKIGHVIWA